MNIYAQRVLDDILAHVQRQWPDKPCSVSGIAQCHPEIIRAYATGIRVKVRDSHGYERTGTVSRSAGWQPTLLLMHRVDAHASSDTLGPDDRIVAVWRGREYVPATSIY